MISGFRLDKNYNRRIQLSKFESIYWFSSLVCRICLYFVFSFFLFSVLCFCCTVKCVNFNNRNVGLFNWTIGMTKWMLPVQLKWAVSFLILFVDMFSCTAFLISYLKHPSNSMNQSTNRLLQLHWTHWTFQLETQTRLMHFAETLNSPNSIEEK